MIVKPLSAIGLVVMDRGRRRVHAAVASLQQLGAQPLLEAFDPLGDGRLRQ
jgi:hypothetical protein